MKLYAIQTEKDFRIFDNQKSNDYVKGWNDCKIRFNDFGIKK